MRVVKVFFENGDIITTNINGTNKSIERYYLNKIFNIGSGEDDLMSKCIKVECFENDSNSSIYEEI